MWFDEMKPRGDRQGATITAIGNEIWNPKLAYWRPFRGKNGWKHPWMNVFQPLHTCLDLIRRRGEHHRQRRNAIRLSD
jgi:hypothetical protein